MNRLQEVDAKHALIRAVLDKRNADGLWFQRTRNIAWMTAGADASIPIDSETGVYSVLVTREHRMIFTPNNEQPRLRQEELLEELGFELQPFDWFRLNHPLENQSMRRALVPSERIITDTDAEPELWELRIQLMEPEQIRYRALGFDAAAALEEAISATRRGDSEWQIAARLDAAARQRGGLAVVNLVAVDDRINRFRHPLITDKQVTERVMMVLCMRRGGLIAAATRFAQFGSIPAALMDKARRVAFIDVTAMNASTPGRTLNDVFTEIQAAYTAVGEDGQWRHQHQGGLIGYDTRERLAKPGDGSVIPLGGACAWNPSIVGISSEDTIVIGENGFEILTAASENFPAIAVEIDGKTIRRPGILEL